MSIKKAVKSLLFYIFDKNPTMEIVWTPEAELSFDQNLNYLENTWPSFVYNDFLDKVDSAFEILKSNPLAGSFDEKNNCRKFLIVERITLRYMVDGQHIVLLTFFNNWRKP